MDIKDSMHPPGLIFSGIMGIGIITQAGIIIGTGIISGKTQVGIIINGVINNGIIMEVASSNNGLRMVVSKLGIADSFISIIPVAIAVGIFLLLDIDKIDIICYSR
jgi:hypothetical protein